MSGDKYISEDTYPVSFACENCGFETYYYPPKGDDIKTHLNDKSCDRCGCDIIQRRERKNNYSW